MKIQKSIPIYGRTIITGGDIVEFFLSFFVINNELIYHAKVYLFEEKE